MRRVISPNNARWITCRRWSRVEQQGIVRTMENWTQHLHHATFKTNPLSLSHSNVAGILVTQSNAFMNENTEDPRREVNQPNRNEKPRSPNSQPRILPTYHAPSFSYLQYSSSVTTNMC